MFFISMHISGNKLSSMLIKVILLNVVLIKKTFTLRTETVAY